MDLILQPWPWYVAGPLLAFVMFGLVYFDKTLGFSSNFRTVCTLAGAGKAADFFRYDWQKQKWNLVFLGGAIMGGVLSYHFLMADNQIKLSSDTTAQLKNEFGFKAPDSHYLPPEIFGRDALSSTVGIAILLIGGLLVGFGARYAGGCTSGHAITGLSNLQIPSLIAVIGFFIGGLIMTHWGLPLLFS